MREERGISPIMATMFLLIITIAVAGILYYVVVGWGRGVARVLNFDVQDASIVRLSDNNVAVSVTIKNSGTAPIDNVEVTVLELPAENFVISGVIQPGDTRSADFTIHGSVTIGTEYTLRLRAWSGTNTITKIHKVSAQ